MNIKTITFTKSASDFILDVFGKTTNEEGYLVEKSNPEQKVLNPYGEEIHIDQFAGIKKGSEVFIKSDLISLMRLCDDLA
jgi:hypothetical protein